MTYDPNVIYVYRSPFGTLSIRAQENRRAAWFLFYETFAAKNILNPTVSVRSLTLGWRTPELAAEAVYMQETGWKFWDQLPFVVFPRALEDWTEVPAHGFVLPSDPGS